MAASFRIMELGLKPVVGDLVYKLKTDRSKRLKSDKEMEKDAVMKLSESDLENYSIYDIILPLPGFDVEYPDNPVADYVTKLMLADGIDLRERHNVKDYSLPGGYRNVVIKPTDFSWQLMKNLSNETDELLLSDADLLDGKTLSINQNEGGNHMALIVSFTLQSSAYATMAIRELLKMPSDYGFPVREDVAKADKEADVPLEEAEDEEEQIAGDV